MTDHDFVDLGPTARVVSIQVADAPEAWGAAGFTVTNGRIHLGATTIEVVGPQPDDQRGVVGWGLAGLAPPGHDEPTAATPTHIDGLPTDFAGHDGLDRGRQPSNLPDPEGTDSRTGEDGGEESSTSHPNGATGIDHVVVSTPDLERTIAALAAVGLQCRRIRKTEAGGEPMRQAFFRLGPTILEVVSGAEGSGTHAEDDPATFFGLAIDVEDLNESADLLGDGLGGPKGAVQQGRRIATLRHRSFDMSIAVALMDDHADR